MIKTKSTPLALTSSINRLYELSLIPKMDLSYHSTISAIFEIVYQIKILEEKKIPKEEIKQMLSIPTEIIGRSKFFKHMQDWPRGYPGDYKMIEYVMEGHNLAEPGSIEYHIENYGLMSPASQQHRNKVGNQAKRILDKIRKCNNGKTKILSIACGNSPDFELIKDYINPETVEILLLDGDEDAIKSSLDNLKGLSGSIQTIVGNIFRNLLNLKAYGKFDLVIIGGLFDYLEEHLIVKILKNIKKFNLSDTGNVFFTNISPSNPDRIWIEYLANWNLISRSAEELISIATKAGFYPDNITVSMEKSNITYLVDLVNNDTC